MQRTSDRCVVRGAHAPRVSSLAPAEDPIFCSKWLEEAEMWERPQRRDACMSPVGEAVCIGQPRTMSGLPFLNLSSLQPFNHSNASRGEPAPPAQALSLSGLDKWGSASYSTGCVRACGSLHPTFCFVGSRLLTRYPRGLVGCKTKQPPQPAKRRAARAGAFSFSDCPRFSFSKTTLQQFRTGAQPAAHVLLIQSLES